MKQTTIFTTTLLTLSLGCISALQADVTDAQMRSLENRVSSMEQKRGSNAMVNPPGRPQVRDGADLFFTADWLLWQGHENGLGYAVKTTADQSLATALYDSSTKNMHFDWDFGFRVGLGYNLPHDGWDLSAGWTWFQNNAKGRTEVGTGNLLSTNLFPVNNLTGDIGADEALETFTSINSNLNIKLNMIDLDLGREFFVSKWMTLRPFMGLRTGWIRQKLNVANIDPSASFIAADTIESLQSKDESNYWGLGLRAGLNTQWGLGYGLSFFGNASASLLNGFFSTSNYEYTEFEGGTHNDFVTNENSYRVGRVIAELAMGLRWDTMFANDRCHFGIQGGWEQLMFFGQNQFQHFYGESAANAGSYFANQGDLTFQGWTLSARLDF